MAKIEIEEGRLIYLTNKIGELESQRDMYASELNRLNEESLTKKDVLFAQQMCAAYFSAIAKGLGFDESEFRISESYEINNLIAEFGKKWIDEAAIVVYLSANISEEFSKAYLKMGVDAEKQQQKKLSINKQL